MGSLALTDATIYIGEYDFTTDSNMVKVNASAEELDATTFGGGGYRSRKGGLRDIEMGVEGFANYGTGSSQSPDYQGFVNLGTADQAVTVSPTGVATDVAYMTQLGKFTYETFGEIGQMAPFKLGMKGSNAQGVVRGALGKAKGAVSATGALGSGCQLGAVSATQYLYATFHVHVAATTITVVLESDDNSGFTSAVTRATIGPLTAVGGTWVTRVAGAITDDWYRFRVTAITGTFTVSAAAGVQ